ncbi:hypothetical protein ASF20_15855 [Methylobacterium sp. Leaf88]|nr:hypothetical protein ASF20_15855 [Methylobacterium sp. Leaf88]
MSGFDAISAPTVNTAMPKPIASAYWFRRGTTGLPSSSTVPGVQTWHTTAMTESRMTPPRSSLFSL